MRQFYKFLMIFSIAVFSVSLSVPFISQANEVSGAREVNEAQDIAGTWSVVETYTCCGNYPASWKFTKKSETTKKVTYTLTATRTSTGNVKQGTAKLKKKTGKVAIRHGCYGDGCGSCGYVFTGKATASQISGKADYCSGTTGTFVATKASGDTNEIVAPIVSDGEPNPN